MFFRLNRKLTLSIATAFLTAGIIGAAYAQDFSEAEEYGQLSSALPEIADDDAKVDEVRSGALMKCFVDTPAFDNFTSPFCFSNGTAFTTSAVFRIDGEPSNFTILWSDSSCSSSSDTCVLPIRQFETINLSATILDNNNNTFANVSATARYEGFQ